MKRALIVGVLVGALWANTVNADLSGPAQQARADHRCQRLGAALSRHRNGIVPRELARLERRNCKLLSGRWVSSLYFAAEGE